MLGAALPVGSGLVALPSPPGWGGGETSPMAAQDAGSRGCAAFGGGGLGRDSASATTLSVPGVCLTSAVNSEMNASCLCWRGVHGGDTLCMACTRGL